MSRHTLSVLVEDKPGVLTRVASLFARRAFNINSLAVGPTEVPGMSRMTVVVDADGDLIEQVTKQLNKLGNNSKKRGGRLKLASASAESLNVDPGRERCPDPRRAAFSLGHHTTQRQCLAHKH